MPLLAPGRPDGLEGLDEDGFGQGGVESKKERWKGPSHIEDVQGFDGMARWYRCRHIEIARRWRKARTYS